jgi:putative ABC transport system permease protein
MYYMHYVYITSEYYRQVFGSAAEPNAVLTQLTGELSVASGSAGGAGNGVSGAGNGVGGAGGNQNASNSDRVLQETIAGVLEKKGVTAVLHTSSILNTFRDVVNNLNFVVIVLILSAGALAFVVLLNLTNININERIRELATIEVLGFYDKEVSAYVYRENAALTAIGIIIGLGLGTILHRYVIMTAETEPMMFGRSIKTASFVYSALLTLGFSVFVNMVTAAKLRRINMVEALKSME